MRITFVTRKFGNVERNSQCDVLHVIPERVARLFLDCNGVFAIKAYSVRVIHNCYLYIGEGACATTGNNCVSSCKNQVDGDYQSCDGCHMYITCSNGISYDKRPCPPTLVWNDNKKLCDWKSSTCKCIGELRRSLHRFTLRLWNTLT